ncbi:hypothetical protein ACFL20_03315 [Spirochaetota bacterium]
MKISVLILSLVSSIIILNCSTSTGGDSTVGFYDPGNLGSDVTDLNETKEFNFGSITESCTASEICNAIIYQGNGYVGIAVDDSHEANRTDRDFKLMVYWAADSIPTNVDLNTTQYTIKIWKGSSVYTVATGNLNLTISPGGNSTMQSISFGGAIDVDGLTVEGTDTIVAQRYASQ